ncbi:MAG TPA: helix-turn-helix domain-containing protein [Ktedonobacteraceae bacterium]
MQTATPISYEDNAHLVTFTAHTQAVERAIQTMHAHMDESLTLEDLASVACLSPYHFNRVFSRLIGIPPGEFLSALRFQTARRLLLTTPLKVIDICFAVGYTSTGSFTSRFTQLVGLSPRVLRQRAHAFEPLPVEHSAFRLTASSHVQMPNTLIGRISAPTTFQGTIYVGLFLNPIPQGMPVRCLKLGTPGRYLFHNIADGIYHLRAAAFPASSDLQSSLLPGEKMLLGNNTDPLIIKNGYISGNPNLILHSPRLTDPPLVMGLPLL